MLLPAVDGLLSSLGLAKKDIRGIIVGTGPGTFSGLRVGVATARALAQALRIGLAGSSSLRALASGLAEGAPAGCDRLLPVIDARRKQVFCQVFGRDDAGIAAAQSEIMCLNPGELQPLFSGSRSGSVFAGGDGVVEYYGLFEAAAEFAVPGPDDDLHFIKARYHIPEAGGPPGFSLEEVNRVVPVYVRDPDADKTVLLRKREPWLE